MHNIYFFIFILATSNLFTSCSTNTSKYHPVRNHSPRVSTLGFHISPPPGGDWYEKHFEDSLFYFKRTKPNTYALTTRATELVFEDIFSWKGDFLEYVKNKKGLHEGSAERYRNCSQDYKVEEISSSLCVRYQHIYDDYGDAGKGKFAFVKVVSNGIICLHPESPRVGIDINYLEKSIPQANDPSFRNEGETFLSSLSFLSPSTL